VDHERRGPAPRSQPMVRLCSSPDRTLKISEMCCRCWGARLPRLARGGQ
jgi:hypothetical protein